MGKEELGNVAVPSVKAVESLQEEFVKETNEKKSLFDVTCILEEVYPMAKLSNDNGGTLVLTDDWDGEDIYILAYDCFLSELIVMQESPIKNVVYENPDLCLKFGMFGKEVGDRTRLGHRTIESGVLTFEDIGYIRLSGIGHTDNSVIVIPHKIHYDGETDLVQQLSLDDKNPISPNVREIILMAKGESIMPEGDEVYIDVNGKFCDIFPSLQRIVNSSTVGYDFSFGNPVEATPLFLDDEEMEAIRDTPEYRYQMEASERGISVEEVMAECLYQITNECYWIKSANIEGYYNIGEAELRIDRIFGMDSKEILIPDKIRIMGKNFPVNTVEIDGSELEIVWLPRQCKLLGFVPKKAFCFYDSPSEITE